MAEYFVLLILIVLLAGALAGICYSPSPMSLMEQDEATCYSLREDGWTEKEIQDFMTEHDGFYFPPDEKEE